MTVLFHNNVLPIFDQNHTKCNSIVVELFQHCNLKCDFCTLSSIPNNKVTKFNPDTILKFIPQIRKSLPYIDTTSKFGICVLGGELFQDQLDYSVYDQFFTQLEYITTGYDCFVEVASNMMFKDREKVLDLVSKHNITLNASFDLVGRFTKPNQIQRAFDNIVWFADHITTDKLSVCFVAHRLNIESVLNNGENKQYFDKLYNHPNISITFGDYISIDDKPQYNVDDELILQFYQYMFDHYPNIQEIVGLSEDTPKRRCKEIHITQTGIDQGHCSVLANQHTHYKEQFFNNLECLNCDYFKKCSFMCYYGYHNLKACWKKILYNKLNNQ